MAGLREARKLPQVRPAGGDVSEVPAGQVEHTTAQVNIKAESGRVCVTINQDGRFISQMRLTPQQAESVAMQMLLSATECNTR